MGNVANSRKQGYLKARQFFILTIMNIGATVHVCVTDVVAIMLVIHSCSLAHGACIRLEFYLCIVSAVPRDTSSHLVRRY